ncbi:PREDICTED: uncharacterized protein LOC109339940, partial [Lupinus angustifolius]|uniref:uncharacterized protein LOC109339940 n=1 Tax=Lupinus angustifolius TaxID=3871 RepID=UPI00092F411A
MRVGVLLLGWLLKGGWCWWGGGAVVGGLVGFWVGDGGLSVSGGTADGVTFGGGGSMGVVQPSGGGFWGLVAHVGNASTHAGLLQVASTLLGSTSVLVANAGAMVDITESIVVAFGSFHVVHPNIRCKLCGDLPVSSPISPSSPSLSPSKKSFAQILRNSYDVGASQLPKPCIEGDSIAIKIPEEDYQAGLQRCKFHLHGRIIMSKGDTPLKLTEMKDKLSTMWSMIRKWSLVSLGKGYYEFAFSSIEDMRSVCSVGSWSLKPGFFRIFLWTTDFNPNLQKLSHTRCWVKIHNLPQEYWSPRIIFSIAGGIGTPISLDDATSNRSFGHFSKVLVELNLKDNLPDQILVEREGYAFFVNIEYDNLPNLCQGCQAIGHLVSQCRKVKKKEAEKRPDKRKKYAPGKFDSRAGESNEVAIPLSSDENPNPEVLKGADSFQDLVINLDIDSRAASNLNNMERLVLTPEANPAAKVVMLESDTVKTDNLIVQDSADLDNITVANDMRLVGRLWANDQDNDDTEVEFTEVISKSQKKKLKAKENSGRVHFTRQEPMVSQDIVKSKFWVDLNLHLFVVNNRNSLLPSIWGLCRVGLCPRILGNYDQHIDMVVEVENQRMFISAVYAHTNYSLRRSLWKELTEVMRVDSGPWCCIGDFNVVLGAHECRGERLPARPPMDDFKRFSDSSELLHLPTSGSTFTWSNRRKGHALTEKRLDRALCNNDWINVWNHVTCCTLYKSASDHHHIMLNSSNNVLDRIKLRLIKHELKSWNINVFGSIHNRVRIARSKVDDIQQLLDGGGTDHMLLAQEDLAQTELLQAFEMEEGDRNTAFFHRVSKIRQSTKAISMLRVGDTILSNQDEIARHILDYFTGIFASLNITTPNSLIDSVIPNLVSKEDNRHLAAIPSNEEIKNAVFNMNGDGAPGPDGFGGCFYQDFWDIIQVEVCNSVRQFFAHPWLLPNLNSNNIILIPKVIGADRVEDFRPIALANFQFKIISKVLADRLAIIAPKLISNHQRGFIKDRKIQDCICIASEAINMLDHKTFRGNLAIKLDIMKAFDTLDWEFLLDTLNAFGFGHKFISFMRAILQSAKLSICVNGRNVGFFSCRRGVRQGDPLLPLLFCLAEEVLSRGIQHRVNDHKISTISGPNGLVTLSHALYADDVFIFCKGIKRELQCLKNLIRDYAHCSGQHINISKCKFYIGSVSARKIATLTLFLGFSAGSFPFNYVGVPIFKGRPKRIHLQPIADRILHKLGNWKGKLLSIMDRVELVRSVIQSMLMFSFQIYKWPPQIMGLEGGLGLRSLKMLNKVALLKLPWEMRSLKQEWASFCRKRFGCSNSPTTRYYRSSIWSGIKDNWNLVGSNSIWLVGDGNQVSFWRDNWMGTPLVDTLHIPLHLHNCLTSSVADFILDDRWRLHAALVRFAPDLAGKIACYNRDGGGDNLVWQHTSDGVRTLKASYMALSVPSPKLSWCKLIWARCIPPSKSFLIWRILHRKMPTDDNLQSRGCMMASACSLCHSATEDPNHLFLTCCFAKSIWNWSMSVLSINLDFTSVASILSSRNHHFNKQVTEVLLACVINAISGIWYCCNKKRFEDKKISLSLAIAKLSADTTLAGNLPSVTGLTNINDLVILRKFQVATRIPKAPKILEVVRQNPQDGWIKANTDGAAHGSPGYAGGGGIFRDSSGACLVCFASYLSIQNAVYAEMHSAIKAVNIAFNRGWRNLWLESNSTTVVDIFNNNSLAPWKLFADWNNCKRKLQSMNVRITHIYREGNSCADKLASY